jgi:hypothetical protein
MLRVWAAFRGASARERGFQSFSATRFIDPAPILHRGLDQAAQGFAEAAELGEAEYMSCHVFAWLADLDLACGLSTVESWLLDPRSKQWVASYVL